MALQNQPRNYKTCIKHVKYVTLLCNYLRGMGYLSKSNA